MHRHGFFLAPAILLSVWNASYGQDSKLYTPQPQHALLKRFAGEWQFVKAAPTADDGKARKTLGSGTMKGELLGGFFVVCKWSGKIGKTKFNAVQTLGYDVAKKKYTGTWIDSLMSYRWQLDGPFQRNRKELVLNATGPGPKGGTAKFRERYRFRSADSITVVGEMWRDKKWVAFMTTELTRPQKKK